MSKPKTTRRRHSRGASATVQGQAPAQDSAQDPAQDLDDQRGPAPDDDRNPVEEAAPPARGRLLRHRRRLLLDLALTVAVIGAFLAAGVASNRSHSPAVLTYSTIAGGLAMGNVFAHRWLTPRLGRITALLVLCLVAGTLMLALTAAAPTCPDSLSQQRCSGGELANWAAIGMLLPLVMAVSVGTPVLLGRLTLKLTKVVTRHLRRKHARP